MSAKRSITDLDPRVAAQVVDCPSCVRSDGETIWICQYHDGMEDGIEIEAAAAMARRFEPALSEGD